MKRNMPHHGGAIAMFCYVVSLGVANAQKLPAPHGNLEYFGYYFVDTKYGDFRSETNPYTNLAVIGPGNLVDTVDPDWQTPFDVVLNHAASDGKRILLLMSRSTDYNQVFTWEEILAARGTSRRFQAATP